MAQWVSPLCRRTFVPTTLLLRSSTGSSQTGITQTSRSGESSSGTNSQTGLAWKSAIVNSVMGRMLLSRLEPKKLLVAPAEKPDTQYRHGLPICFDAKENSKGKVEKNPPVV